MKKLLLLLLSALLANFIFADDKKPDFLVVDIKGISYTHKTTDGKFLIINFWATWCPPCVKEIPELVEFYEKYADKVEILGFGYENKDFDEVKSFIDSFMVDYPIVMLKNQRLEFEKFPMEYLPTSFIYNPNGELIDVHTGELRAIDLVKLMNLQSKKL